MAYLESAVVVYLREIYYPNRFYFPLVDTPAKILYIEIGREIATILMLWVVARLIATNKREVFAYFIFNFGVWDIGYYVWLKIFLDWPTSLLDWDVLFLIPLPWIGPVLAPVIISISLIVACYLILSNETIGTPVMMSRLDWFFEIVAGMFIIFSFLTQSKEVINKEVPHDYHWWLFLIGLLLGLYVFSRRIIQCKGTRRNIQQ
jgi:hypothetical protein